MADFIGTTGNDVLNGTEGMTYSRAILAMIRW